MDTEGSAALPPRKGPHGLHYFDRDRGINVLVDEVVPPRDEWSEVPRTLSVALSNTCDYACPHCFAPKTDGELDLDHVGAWATELAHDGGHSIGFGGGEPTLVEGLPSLCHRIARSTELAVTLTTHGHNFTREYARTLSGAVHFIRVSIGGLYETYEAVHHRSFSRLLSRLPAISSIAPIGFNCLVNSVTIGSLDRMAEFALDHGAVEVLLLPQVAESGGITLSSAEVDTLALWIQENHDNYPLSLSAHASERVPVSVLPVGDPRGGTYDFLHVDASGELKPSAFGGVGTRIGPDGLAAAVRRLRLTMVATSEE